MSTVLEQLKTMTHVVADTADFEAVKTYQPTDCTTNPSIVLSALQDPKLQSLLWEEIRSGHHHRRSAEQIALNLTVALGSELSQLLTGRISTEVDARLSFDTEASIDAARDIINAYAQRGIASDRVLIKLAATWEGIKAAEILERQGIQCNLTLIFSEAQAVACADAGVTLISPFVGRITDWYKKQKNISHFEVTEDPGVQAVTRIYTLFKAHARSTIVMGASFRTTAQIEALAGCDKLTIAPALLDQLNQQTGTLTRALTPEPNPSLSWPSINQLTFEAALAEDPMTHEMLTTGITKFATDQERLLNLIRDRLDELAA